MIDAGSFTAYRDAIKIIVEHNRITTSMIQRYSRIGYTQAARIMDLLEENGIIGPINKNKEREILLSVDELKQLMKGEVGMSKKKKADEKKEDGVTFLETPFDKNLKVELKPAEVMAQAEKMARLQQEIAAKEDEAGSVNKRYKSEIEELYCQQDSAAGLVRDKFEFRTVKCLRRLDWKTGMVTEVRSDTSELIDERLMTAAETQMQMALNDEKKDKPAGEKAQDPEHVPEKAEPIEISEDEIKTATEIIKEMGRASTATITRRMKIKASKSARLMEVLEQRGIVGPPNGDEPRAVLVDLSGETTKE